MLPSVKFAENKVFTYSLIVFRTSGSIKERTRTSTERGIGCQRNGYWLATNHLSGRGLCSQSRSYRLRQGGVPEGAVH